MFKTYRLKGVVQAQEVVADMLIPDPSAEGEDKLRQIKKGDYLKLIDGVGVYESKAEFESKYEPVRQKKASAGEGSTTKKKKKNAVVNAADSRG